MGTAVSPVIAVVSPPEAEPVRSVRIELPAQHRRGSEDGGVARVEAPGASDWYGEALERMNRLTALAVGWNGHDAQEIKGDMAMSAVTFLANVAYPGIAAPSIVPISDGGVQVEWHRGGLDVEISFSDEDPGVYVEDRKSGDSEELSLAEAIPTVRRYWQRLRES
jgi:hypothetical protein